MGFALQFQTKEHNKVNETRFSFTFMESVTSPPLSTPPEASSHYDELFMQQSLLFSNSLEDLKNLRKQLYSAAEYFEQSYIKDDSKLLVMDSLKDYTVKALVNTIDHLGFMAYKVESLLDERIGKVPGFELRLSCIEQRIQTCQEFTDRENIFQQSLVIETPKHHKRYIIPAADTMPAVRHAAQEFQSCSLYAEDGMHRFRNGTNYFDCLAKIDRAMTRGTPPPLLRKRHCSSPLLQSCANPVPFSFLRIAPINEREKQRVSLLQFPLMHSGSLVSRSPSPNSCNAKWRYPSEPRRSISVVARAEKEWTKEKEQYSSKSKRLFKALLSMRTPKKDGTLHKYLDEN